MAIVLIKTKILSALRRPCENSSEKSLRVETNFQGQFHIVSNVHAKKCRLTCVNALETVSMFTLNCDDANARTRANSCCLYRALKIKDQLILRSHAGSIC